MSKIYQSEIDSLDTRFSMRMFIADLPRVLNEAFALIKKFINTIYNCDTNELRATSMDTKTLKASTIITNNIAFQDSSGQKNITYGEIEDMKIAIERIKDVLNIQ